MRGTGFPLTLLWNLPSIKDFDSFQKSGKQRNSKSDNDLTTFSVARQICTSVSLTVDICIKLGSLVNINL